MSTSKKSKSKRRMMFLGVKVKQDRCLSCNCSLNWKKTTEKLYLETKNIKQGTA